MKTTMTIMNYYTNELAMQALGQIGHQVNYKAWDNILTLVFDQTWNQVRGRVQDEINENS